MKKEILDDCTSTIDYVAKRLNWDEMTKENLLKRYPSIAKCNVTKVIEHKHIALFMSRIKKEELIMPIHFNFQAKSLIDYLLNETHFTEHDITSCPRVFSNSVETLENRIKELQSVKLKPERMYIICLDRKNYLKFIERHCSRLNDKEIWSNFQKIETKIKQKCK